MANGITLSKEYGVNPSVEICAICGSDMSVVMFGTAYKDPKTGKTAEAPHQVCLGNVCDNCKKILDNGGVFFIEIRDGECDKHPDNPYRTGRLVAVKKEAAESIFKDCKGINYIEQTPFEQVFGKYVPKDETSK